MKRARTTRAIFLDKDGTLVENDPYNVDPARIRFYPDVRESLQAFAAAGYLLVIVSNQSGVARGFFAESALQKVETAMRDAFREMGASLAGFYYCPHDPQGSVKQYQVRCECRKPQPGLLVQAAQELDIELQKSWMIGDILHDVEAGNRAGCKTVLLDRGNETEWHFSDIRLPDLILRDMSKAASRICAERLREVAA
jgi:D-glycero-D-manno-heptose 1,7-bisphosphate phosphatase